MLLWENPDLHAEIQQRLLEAEIGSASTFHFASGSRNARPGRNHPGVCDAAPPVLRVRIQDGSGLARLYVAAIPGYASSPVDIGLLQGVLQEAGQGQLADVVRRSIDLIDRYSRPDDRFTEFAAI